MTDKNLLVTRHSSTRHCHKTAPPRAIFNGFARVGLSGFGGVLPWVRRTVVDEEKWLSPEEFNGMLGMCQIVPGPSILSLSVCVGYRLAGLSGSVAAFSGLVLGPLMLVLLIASVYTQAIHLPAVAGLMRGISAVGIGLLLSTGVRMLREGMKEPVMLWVVLPLFGLLVIGHWRLHEAIALTLPLSAAIAWWRSRPAQETTANARHSSPRLSNAAETAQTQTEDHLPPANADTQVPKNTTVNPMQDGKAPGEQSP